MSFASTSPERTPCAPTFFRAKILDEATRNQRRRLEEQLHELLWKRDGAAVQEIQVAQTPERLINLLPLATGLGQGAWFERMAHFGEQAIPVMVAHLQSARQIEDDDVYLQTVETLIAGLRWYPDQGGQGLLEAFGYLESYARSLASVALGLLGESSAADRIWEFYQQVKGKQHPDYLVGALWGLIDLADRRAAEAVAGLLAGERRFPELFVFASQIGDQRSIHPLIHRLADTAENERLDLLMALTGVGHRVGRDALLVEIRSAGFEAEEEPERMVSSLFSRSKAEVDDYFSIYFRGLAPGSAERMLDMF